MYNRDSEIDMEMVASFLKNAVNKVKTQENPDLLNDLKKIYKKNVPFSMRLYVAAYLVKEAQRGRSSFRSRRDFHDNKHKPLRERPSREHKPMADFRNNAEERPTRPHIQIDPAMASTIFISIGRNRRVFPRDLVGLLIAVGGLERDRIGDIKVLANYSFVQLYSNDAQTAIEKLNGYDYRGRKLAVSFSRQKSEEELADNENAESQDFDAESQDYVEDEAMAAEDAAAYAAAEKAASDKQPFGLN